MTARSPIAVWYEHPDWFRPLFRELERRGLPHVRLHAAEHRYDPAGRGPDIALLLNRMSPSAHLRGHGAAVSHTLAYLEHLARRGLRVVNGLRAFRTEISKARQIGLMDSLELSHPATRVVDAPDQVSEAARELRFPVLVKANRGGSGAGIRRYESPAELGAAAAAGEVALGPDGTALVQELVPARGGHITRVEVLDGDFLYAIRVHRSGDDFDLCPADLRCAYDGGGATGDAAPPASGDGDGDATRPGEPDDRPSVEAATPPDRVIRDVERLTRAAGIEVGGVEYLVDDRDGTVRYYDVNALSNFVAEPERVVGFDPFRRMVDWLEREAWAPGARSRDGWSDRERRGSPAGGRA